MSCQKGCKCCNIKVTQERFLYLVEHGLLKSCQTYEITDIFDGLFVTTVNNSTFETNAQLLAYLPQYEPEGDYKGQYHAELGAINNGEVYTWGEYNYKNESGGSVTIKIEFIM